MVLGQDAEVRDELALDVNTGGQRVREKGASRVPTIAEVLNCRGDLSTFVVHLTRDYDDKDAPANLLSILQTGGIEARSPMGWAKDEAVSLGRAAENSQRVVSFSETPLEHIYSLFADIPYRRIRLQPYGIAFTKMVARRKGVNPVWYVDMTPGRDWQIAKALDALRAEAVASSSFRNHPAARIFPFVERIGTWPAGQKEFWWEREWRHIGDFYFGLEDVALVLCPEAEHAAFEVIAGRKCVDPGWSLERMIAKLVGLQAADVTPFSG